MEEENSGLIDAVNTINIKDAIHMVAIAFEEIPHNTFIKSYTLSYR